MPVPTAPRHRVTAVARRPPVSTVLVVVATLAVLGQPPIATADVARISVVDQPVIGGPVRATITITAPDGGTRTLGPHPFRHYPDALTASPDGRLLAVDSGRSDEQRQIVIVPTDGGSPFELRTKPRSLVVMSASDLSWSADGRDLVIGSVDDRRSPRGHRWYPATALRCPIVTRVCREIPNNDGLAATVPGGFVTSTPLYDVLPFDSPFAGGAETVTIDARPARRSRAQQRLLRDVRTPYRTRTTLVSTAAEPPARTVSERTSRLVDGIDAAISVLGGPSGALIVHDHHRVSVTRRGTKLRLRSQESVRRWTTIAPDGTRRTRALPRLRIPKAHSTTRLWGRKLIAQRAGVVPSTAIGTGGWLGTVGVPSRTDTGGLVLVRIAPSGTARFARSGGRPASASALVRSALGRVPSVGSAVLEVIGYESATQAAIVTLSWAEGPLVSVKDGVIESPADEPGADYGPLEATVRVPLDGRTTPSVVDRERGPELRPAVW